MDLSIVTTLFHSEPYLQEFCQRANKAADEIGAVHELILVNDGSPDRSLEMALDLQKKDPHVKVIDLTRNFGHHQALMAGLACAQGEKVFLIDSDLEEQPEWLASFHGILQKEKCDVVYGQQIRRKGTWTERLFGTLFYKFFNALSRTPIPQNTTSARLMTRRYVQALLSFHERELFIPGLWQLAGYIQVACPVNKQAKTTTTYSLARKIALAVNAVTSFSDKPLVSIFYTGVLICLMSGVYILWLLFRKFVYGSPIMGWPSLIVSIWLLGGLTIFFLGILGIYLSKVYLEIKQRPPYLIRQVYPGPARRDDTPSRP